MDDEYLDYCEGGLAENPTPDDELDYIVLFADALDPNTPSIVEEKAAEWKELFDATN